MQAERMQTTTTGSHITARSISHIDNAHRSVWTQNLGAVHMAKVAALKLLQCTKNFTRCLLEIVAMTVRRLMSEQLIEKVQMEAGVYISEEEVQKFKGKCVLT